MRMSGGARHDPRTSPTFAFTCCVQGPLPLGPHTNDCRIHSVEGADVGVFDVVVLLEVEHGLLQSRFARFCELRGGASRDDVFTDVLVHGF
jgi:hypothetical protein